MLNAKEKKRLYDIEYRRKNKARIAANKKADYEANKDQFKEKHREYRNRPENVARHNEYCRQSGYVEKKHLYDVVRRNMKNYGKFWESAILVNHIEIEVRKRIPKKERASYKKNVKAIVSRNIAKRFNKVIQEINNGEDVGKSRIKNFGFERKQFLESLIFNKK